MSKNRYKFTVEKVTDQGIDAKSLVFEATSHEDIFHIVQLMQEKMEFEKDETTSLAVGLKLFSTVLLKYKDRDPFKKLLPHFKEFMKELKQ